jgi:hypothetical protein
MPVLVIRDDDDTVDAPSRVVLLLDFDTEPEANEPAGLVNRLVQSGAEVFRVYPRATGAGVPPNEDADLYGMALGKPILAGRVHDVRAVRRFIGARIDRTRDAALILLARGEQACSVASYCALLGDYGHVILDRPIAAWQRYLDREVRPAYRAVLPMQLKACDLPQMWAAIAPARLTLLDPRDVAGGDLSAGDRRAVLEVVRTTYTASGRLDRFACVPAGADIVDIIVSKPAGGTPTPRPKQRERP